MSTKQAETWLRQFGAEYTSRNNLALEDYEKLYVDTIGVTRSALNEVFFANVPKDARILEVGTNVGNQLLLLQRAGFTNLHGVELQWEAIEIAQRKLGRANIVQGTALEIPFRDDWFDLVFTSGVLIHISPEDLPQAMKEIHRCSKRCILGDEYWSPETVHIPYRGLPQLLWKADYPRLYMSYCPGLKLVREQKRPHVKASNVDIMFLLEKV